MLHQYSSKPHIYKLTDLRNGKIYIGQHNGKEKNYFTGGVLSRRIIEKHGKEVFKREIVVEGDFNVLLLNELEKHHIRLSASNLPEIGYNLTNGGDGVTGYIFTEEDRRRISERMSGEGNHMYGVHLTGEKNPMYGKTHTEEAKRKISENNKGNSAWNRGVKQPLSVKHKQSETMKQLHASGKINQYGEKNPMYGKPAHNRKVILQYSLDGKYIAEYAASSEADKKTNSNGSSYAARGTYTSVNGFIWVFKQDFTEELLQQKIDRYLQAKSRITSKNYVQR